MKHKKTNNTKGIIIGIAAIALVAIIFAYYSGTKITKSTYASNEATSCSLSNNNIGGGCDGNRTATNTPNTPTTITAKNSETISVEYKDNEITPSIINVEKGKKYTIVMTMNHDPIGCMGTILLQGLDERVQTVQRGTTLTFNVDATTPGTYRFVCGAMGMSHGAQVVIQ